MRKYCRKSVHRDSLLSEDSFVILEDLLNIRNLILNELSANQVMYEVVKSNLEVGGFDFIQQILSEEQTLISRQVIEQIVLDSFYDHFDNSTHDPNCQIFQNAKAWYRNLI